MGHGKNNECHGMFETFKPVINATYKMGLLQNGICWIDEQTFPQPHEYWVVSFFNP
jgi:hypothetical protein